MSTLNVTASPSPTPQTSISTSSARTSTDAKRLDVNPSEPVSSPTVQETLGGREARPTPPSGDWQRIGDYWVGKTLGKGGQGVVKMGLHVHTRRKYALKLIPHTRLIPRGSSDLPDVLRPEITAMQRLDHPNILKFYHFYPNAVYRKKNGTRVRVSVMVLELADKSDLFEFLSLSGLFSDVIARTYFHQLVDAVDYCHRNGVAHRDLKPQNVLLDEHFRLKVADFGWAKTFETAQRAPGRRGSRQMLTHCGTPNFIAPEVNGATTQDPRTHYDAPIADIWSLGVFLFCMLAGANPYESQRSDDWYFDKLRHGNYELFWKAHLRFVQVSHEAQDLLNRILVCDPRRRITIEDIKRHPWYQGPLLSPDELLQELQRKKAEVEKKKVKKEEEKRAAAAQAQGGPEDLRRERSYESDGIDSFENITYRSTDRAKLASSDDLPPPTEFLRLDAYVNAVPTSSSKPPFLENAHRSSSFRHRPTGAAVPPAVLEQAVTRFTRFFSSMDDPNLILDRLLEVIEENRGKFERGYEEDPDTELEEDADDRIGSDQAIEETQVVRETEEEAKANSYRVRAVFDEWGEVGFVAQVFRYSDKPHSPLVVDFWRYQGSELAFRKLFLSLRAQLPDILAKQSTLPWTNTDTLAS